MAIEDTPFPLFDLPVEIRIRVVGCLFLGVFRKILLIILDYAMIEPRSVPFLLEPLCSPSINKDAGVPVEREFDVSDSA